MRAIVLLAHGARDARWSNALAALAERLRGMAPHAVVTTAFLEFQPPTLDEALEAAVRKGATDLIVMPVFWASGGHVLDDLPMRLDAFRQTRPGVAVKVLPVLSELPGLLDFVAAAVLHAAGTSQKHAAK